MIDNPLARFPVRFVSVQKDCQNVRSQENIFKKCDGSIGIWYSRFYIELSQIATLTETVFAFPGMGKMLIDSIKASNNTMVIGLVFIFTSLGIFAAMLGWYLDDSAWSTD